MPGRFEKAFRRYGYEFVKLPADLPKQIDLVRDPDAPKPSSAIRLGDDLLLLATSLKSSDRGAFQFVEPTYRLRQSGEGIASHYSLSTPVENNDILVKWRAISDPRRARRPA